MERILKEVLSKLKPSLKEEKELFALSAKILSLIAKQKKKATLEGSTAKGTWISGDHDIDFFVYFDKSVKREKLEKEGLKVGSAVAKSLKSKFEVEYAEHPYTSVFYNNFKVDIVPCYAHKTLKEIQSAVDRTPFHTAYVKKKLSLKQKDDVRLLKQFMKGTGVYGAKEKVHGFSGYLSELLIAYYGSFVKVISEAAKNWKFGIIIDNEGLYPPEDHDNLRGRYKMPLICIDPTDKNRNVGAALEKEKFEDFIFACRAFLKKPSEKFFFPPTPKLLSAAELKKELEKRGHVVAVKFATPKIIEDILYSQLRSSINSIASQLKRSEFRVMETAIYSDNKNSYFIFALEDFELPKIKVHLGPPITIPQKNQDEFANKYKKYKPWVDNGRWKVEIPRKFVRADDFLKEILKKPDRVGVGSYIIKQLKKKRSILSHNEIAKEYKGDFAKFLTAFLTKKKAWEW